MRITTRTIPAPAPTFASILLAVLLGFLALALPAAAAGPHSVPDFTDVSPTYGYYDAIMGLREHGSVHGYGDNTYRPDETLARAQFAKMIVVTLGMTDLMGSHVHESMVAPFTDLGVDSPTSLYPHDYVAVAAERGVTLGTGPGTFSPWRKITRAQVVTMVVRAAFEMNPLSLEDPPTSFVSPWGSFDPTHGPLMRIAHWNGLLNNVGGPGTAPPAGWDPWAEIGRGETAQILWNLLGKS